MNTSAETVSSCFVVAERESAAAEAIGNYLDAKGLVATWVPPRQINEVERALTAGTVERIVLPDLQVLLAATYREEIDLAAWLAQPVRLDVISLPNANAHTVLTEVHSAWSRHRDQIARQRLVGGVVLSIIALLLAFVLLWLIQ